MSIDKDNSICQIIKSQLAQRVPKLEDEFDYMRAAVMLPLVKTPAGLSIMFEVRSPDLSWQPGEICFPGGRIDATDLNAEMAALRETCEELQLSEDLVDICGALDYMTTQMGVIVYPYVGYIKSWEAVNPNHNEVAEVFSVPLAELLKMNPREAEIEVTTKPARDDFPYELLPGYSAAPRRRKGYTVYFYEYNGYVIWGMTARILRGFLNLWREF